ncbi:MAG: thioesterase family protein [Bdellovibrionota bacterium]|nr:thioesterase family protein [Bdellovibrionota bacterium]
MVKKRKTNDEVPVRIKIQLPKGEPLFQSNYTIGIQELNYGNHLGNDKVLSLAHETRVRFLHSLDQGELNFFGTGLIMGGAKVQYLGQGFFADQLKLNLWVDEASDYGFKVFTQIEKETSEIARVEVDMVFFDYEKQSVNKSAGVKEKLESLLSEKMK